MYARSSLGNRRVKQRERDANLYKERSLDDHELSGREAFLDNGKAGLFVRGDSIMDDGHLSILSRDPIHDALMTYQRALAEYEDDIQTRQVGPLISFKIKTPMGDEYTYRAYVKATRWKYIKDKLHRRRYPQIPMADMHVNFAGKETLDGSILADDGLYEGATVNLVVTMRTGFKPGERLSSTGGAKKGGGQVKGGKAGKKVDRKGGKK
ncbi:hypothetical protein DFP72DRAFT_847999 [Ephemerocybe angulata]|uniref:Ubiquitin-like domain-containing protein n=1 Tax=Ephemerocybe angulata TaxID=980116 RepID=A0A8H6HZ96_9AGAR|nr:hypothetical protein DFP72DRAFT_847999 [Tulosesus angulatus]